MDISKIIVGTYEARLSVIPEEKDKALAPARAAETKIKFAHKISELELQIAEASNTLSTAFNDYPLDIDDVVKQLKNIAMLELTKTNLEALAKALFQ